MAAAYTTEVHVSQAIRSLPGMAASLLGFFFSHPDLQSKISELRRLWLERDVLAGLGC